MTGTNHVLTGTLIGLSVHQPVLAIGLALASHFALDALPHYGNSDHTSRGFLTLLALDALCILGILSVLVLQRPDNWLLAALCGLVAASPDLLWLPYWLSEMAGKGWKKSANIIDTFHKRIQWSEKPHNWPVEVVWAALVLSLLVKAS